MSPVFVGWIEDSSGNLLSQAKVINSPIEFYHSLRLFKSAPENAKSPLVIFGEDYNVVCVDCRSQEMTTTPVKDIGALEKEEEDGKKDS